MRKIHERVSAHDEINIFSFVGFIKRLQSLKGVADAAAFDFALVEGEVGGVRANRFGYEIEAVLCDGADHLAVRRVQEQEQKSRGQDHAVLFRRHRGVQMARVNRIKAAAQDPNALVRQVCLRSG